MKHIFAVFVLSTAILFGIINIMIVQSLPPSASLDWYTQFVEQFDESVSISDESLKIDSSGHLHLVYGAQGAVNYARYDGEIWHFETITGEFGIPSLALDNEDEPHIAYIHNYNTLKYANLSGGTWDIQSVYTQSIGSVHSVSLVLDALNQPHMSFVIDEVEQAPGFYYAVKYGALKNGHWNIETIEEGINTQSNYTAGGTSIDLDSSDNPQIVYGLNHLPDSHLVCHKFCIKYVHWTGSNWNSRIVIQGDNTGMPESGSPITLILDTNDVPHLLYQMRIGGAIFTISLDYAQWNGNSWEHTQIYESGVGGGADLALDTNGNPIISYVMWYDTYLARSHDNDWTVEHVDSREDVAAQSTLLALDAQDGIHIISSNGPGYAVTPSLTHSQQFVELMMSTETSSKDNILIGDTFTYTLTFSGPDEHESMLLAPLPDNALYVANSVTAPAIYSPTARAIVWQGSLYTVPTTITYQVSLTDTIGSLTPTPTIISTAWLTDTAYSKVISVTTIVNGEYVYLPLLMR